MAKLLDRFGEDIHLMRDPTRGGLGTVMAEIAKSTRLGIDLSQRKLPVDDQVAGACELLGLDPLYVANEGLFTAIVNPAIADDMVSQLNSMAEGKQAAVVGEVVENHRGQVVLQSMIGGKRVVNMLPGEQLPRIC